MQLGISGKPKEAIRQRRRKIRQEGMRERKHENCR